MGIRRYGLGNDQWDRIKELLSGREGIVGRPARDNRLFVEAVLYRHRAVHTRFSRYDKELYKARHLIENFFAKLKHFRWIHTRYDKTARNFLVAVHLAASTICLN
jgi:transposase